MRNENRIKELADKYSPLIKWMIESNHIYLDIDETIRWGSYWDDDVRVTGSTNIKTNVILVSLAFVDEQYRNKELFVIEYFLLHEMRHIYQHIQIAKYKEGKNDVGAKYIERWIKENEKYEQSVDKDGNENSNYPKQDCELDAYAFAYTAIHYKYCGIYDRFLYVPEIYKNELREDFEKALKEFIKYFKDFIFHQYSNKC